MARIGFVDVGARGGVSTTAARYRDQIHMVLVEPEATEAERLNAEMGGEFVSVVASALGHVDGAIDLFVAQNPQCTSALPLNDGYIDRYTIAKHFKTKQRESIHCSRYDTLYRAGSLPLPHAVKIDVQGFEYQVLQGFGGLLHDCLAIQLEAHFYEIYKGQRLVGDLVRFLSDFDMNLRSIRNVRSPNLQGDVNFDEDLVEVDLYFSKSKRWIANRNDEAKAEFDLACQILKIPPYKGI